MWELYEIQISLSIIKMSLEWSCSFTYVLSMAAFMLQKSSWAVVTETLWPTKLKIFTIWPVREQLCQPLIQGTDHPQLLKAQEEIQPYIMYLLIEEPNTFCHAVMGVTPEFDQTSTSAVSLEETEVKTIFVTTLKCYSVCLFHSHSLTSAREVFQKVHDMKYYRLNASYLPVRH